MNHDKHITRHRCNISCAIFPRTSAKGHVSDLDCVNIASKGDKITAYFSMVATQSSTKRKYVFGVP